MIEYTILDYEGEPTVIKGGEMWEAEPPREVWYDREDRYLSKDEGDIYWDSDKCDWDIDPYDFNGNDREDYGLGWWDCN